MGKFLLALLLAPNLCFARCIPENNFYLPENLSVSGISKTVFNNILDSVVSAYGDQVHQKGFNLVFKRLWSDGTANSDTDVEGQDWVINSYGGLARFPGMTAAAYALVACHELGHHMGGAPLFSMSSWPGGGPAVEGEADYWGTLDCMKHLGYGPRHVHDASLILANVLAVLGGDPKPKPTTPDKSQVDQTYEDHPAAQCRLDTFLAGDVCPARGEMSDYNAQVNSCWTGVGARPRCWFAP